MHVAVADVVLLNRALRVLLFANAPRLKGGFAEVALRSIGKTQHFSWWMTSMLHTASDASPFDRQRQRGELRSVIDSEAARTYLAEAYTGWPHDVR